MGKKWLQTLVLVLYNSATMQKRNITIQDIVVLKEKVPGLIGVKVSRRGIVTGYKISKGITSKTFCFLFLAPACPLE